MDGEMPSRERILAYLLAELPPAELAEIDRGLLTDEALGDLVEDARNELLEACARGTLSEAEAQRARRALHLPPAGRRAGGEEDFARVMAQALQRAAQRPRLGGFLRAGRGGPWAAALAACGVGALGLWLLVRGAGADGGVPPGTSPPGAAFVLVLRPDVTRGPASGQTLRLPAALQSLETQIVVPDASGRYDVQVRSAAGQFQYHNLIPRTVGAVSFVQLAIARDRLPAGTERFLLLRNQPDAPALVHSYSVRVIAP
jgi:hypothetical protein